MISNTFILDDTGGDLLVEESALVQLASKLDALRVRALAVQTPESKPDASLLSEYARAQKAFLGAKIQLERNRKIEAARRAALQAEEERAKQEALASAIKAAAERKSRSIWHGRPLFSKSSGFSYTLASLLVLCACAILWRIAT